MTDESKDCVRMRKLIKGIDVMLDEAINVKNQINNATQLSKFKRKLMLVSLDNNIKELRKMKTEVIGDCLIWEE